MVLARFKNGEDYPLDALIVKTKTAIKRVNRVFIATKEAKIKDSFTKLYTKYLAELESKAREASKLGVDVIDVNIAQPPVYTNYDDPNDYGEEDDE